MRSCRSQAETDCVASVLLCVFMYVCVHLNVPGPFTALAGVSQRGMGGLSPARAVCNIWNWRVELTDDSLSALVCVGGGGVKTNAAPKGAS